MNVMESGNGNSIRAFRERRSGSRNVIIAGSLPPGVVDDYPLACPTGRTYESHQVEVVKCTKATKAKASIRSRGASYLPFCPTAHSEHEGSQLSSGPFHFPFYSPYPSCRPGYNFGMSLVMVSSLQEP